MFKRSWLNILLYMGYLPHLQPHRLDMPWPCKLAMPTAVKATKKDTFNLENIPQLFWNSISNEHMPKKLQLLQHLCKASPIRP